MPEYDINRGINKAVEFKGLVGGNIFLLAGAVGFAFALFLTLYMTGVPLVITVFVTAFVAAGSLIGVFSLNRKYGEHGLMKARARRSSPLRITNRQSRLFLNLNEDKTGRS